MGCPLDQLPKTQDERTVLHSAAQGGNLDVIRILLNSGVDVSAKDKYGQTARDLVQCDDSTKVDGVFSAYSVASLGQASESAKTVSAETDDNSKIDHALRDPYAEPVWLPARLNGRIYTPKLSLSTPSIESNSSFSIPSIQLISPSPPPRLDPPDQR